MTETACPLERFWPAFETPDAVVSAQETTHWPPGALDYLVSAGLLAPAECASQIACTACYERHYEEVESARRPDGTLCHFIRCPEAGRVVVAPDELRLWRPDLKLFARRMKECLGIVGRVSDPKPDRVWRLGPVQWPGGPRLVYLARGLHWADGDDVARSVPIADRPIVLVGFHSMPPSIWMELHPPVVPLAVVTTLASGSLTLNYALLARFVNSADVQAANAGRLAKLTLQRQVDRYAEKRMAEGHKADLIKAFDRQGMSSPEIAEELTRLQMPTHRSTVWKKKKHLVQEDSQTSSRSILRGPSSQPRDKRGRPIKDAQPERE